MDLQKNVPTFNELTFRSDISQKRSLFYQRTERKENQKQQQKRDKKEDIEFL